MKILKLFSLILFLALSSQLHAALTTKELFFAALDNQNNDAAISLYLSLSTDEAGEAVKKKMRKVLGNNWEQTVNAKKSEIGGGAAAGCLTREEAQKIVGVQLPNIANAADAKVELVKFFETGNTGGKLLAEIGATPEQVGKVRNELEKINPKQ